MHRPSSSSHKPFFNSLKQLEKRLKLETPPQNISSPLPIENTQQTDSLGTPIYLNGNIIINPCASTTAQESQIPPQFLSISPDFPPTQNTPLQETHSEIEEATGDEERRSLDDDEIEVLMKLLGLSDCERSNKTVGRFPVECEDDEFYGRIVGLKGPKNVKEVDRLEGWIKHFLNGEKKEPFRLAHLLLGKASLVHGGDDYNGFEGLEFPSTIAEFLQNDPPLD